MEKRVVLIHNLYLFHIKAKAGYTGPDLGSNAQSPLVHPGYALFYHTIFIRLFQAKITQGNQNNINSYLRML